jgi:hypothetical protein
MSRFAQQTGKSNGTNQLRGSGDRHRSPNPQMAGRGNQGRPGPENQAIRAHQPDVMRSFTLTREMLFDDGAGVVEHDLKELTRAYIAHTIECGY